MDILKAPEERSYKTDPVQAINEPESFTDRTNVLLTPLVNGPVDNIVSDMPGPLDVINAQLENLNWPEL